MITKQNAPIIIIIFILSFDHIIRSSRRPNNFVVLFSEEIIVRKEQHKQIEDAN